MLYARTWMVPPYTITLGRFTRPIAITVPGMFLSHPGMLMFASYLRVSE